MRRSISVVLAFAFMAVLLGGCGGGGGGGGNNGVITFTGSNYSVNEDGSVIDMITLHRDSGTGDVSVTVTFTDASATAPSDYDATPILVAWLAGDLTDKVIAVPVVDDHNDEPDEFLIMTIGSPTGGAVVGTQGNATLTIVDNDVAGTVQFDASAYTYGENGVPVGIPVSVTRTGGMDGDINVTVVSSDGTANSDPLSLVEPVDYSPVSVSVFFADQSTTPVMVALSIVQDLLPEIDETFTLSLTNPTNGATLGSPSSATVTIVDDDLFLQIDNPTMGGSLFGTSVLKVGQRLAIGAPGNPVGINLGAGEVLVMDVAPPTVHHAIDGGKFSQEFGTALMLDGLTFAASGLGITRVFGLDQSLTAFSSRFDLSSSIAGFGDALLGMGNGTFAVGAPMAHLGGSILPSGGVGIYDDMTGALIQWMDGAADIRFGAAFARQGSNLLVGAPGNDGMVLRLAGSPLALDLVIPNPSPEVPSSAFGQALGVTSNNFVAIGEPDAGGSNGGKVSFFDGGTGMPTFQAIGAIADGRLGGAITTFGGTRFAFGGTGFGAMAEGIVAVADPTMLGVQIIMNPVPTANAKFGAALCEFDGVLAVGAPGAAAGGKVFLVKVP